MRNGREPLQNLGLKAKMCIYIYVVCHYCQVSYGRVVIELDCHVGHDVIRKCMWYRALDGKDNFFFI